jgi:hypothetical protein
LKKRPLPTEAPLALTRLGRARALQTLVRGGIPIEALKRLLKDALPARIAREMPPEVWSSFATGIAVESPAFGALLAQELHDRLAWDREPTDLEEWWRLVRERPLEALWMGALSANRSVRKEFAHIAEHCLENFRSSPACRPPSWEFVEGILDVHSQLAESHRHLEKVAEEAARRLEIEDQRLEDLRQELKRLRRENAELRSVRAAADRKIESLASESAPKPEEASRLEELERRALRAEREREHLLRQLARKSEGPALQPKEPEKRTVEPDPAPVSSVGTETNPRARILRHIVRKLFKKGKIGASHTHEDNVLRGLPDHEKGIAKEAMALLYREGLLVPKPTVTDPHLSLSPERTTEILAIIKGRSENPRIVRFLEA